MRKPNDVTMFAASPCKCTAIQPWVAASHGRHTSLLYGAHRQTLQRLQGAAADLWPRTEIQVQDLEMRAAAQQHFEVDVASAASCVPFE